MYKFSYTIQDANNTFATDLPTREMARVELKEVKALGYNTAKILREEFIKISERQVR